MAMYNEWLIQDCPNESYSSSQQEQEKKEDLDWNGKNSFKNQ